MKYETLGYNVRDGIATVTLDRPGGFNAFDVTMYRELQSAFRHADWDDAVRVVVVDSANELFGAGGDLKDMVRIADSTDPSDMLRYRDELPFVALRECKKPTIAAIHGTCVGGGLAIAVACDLQVATPHARFGIPEVKRDFIDGLAPAALYGQIPLPALKYLLFTGEFIAAEEALRLGLIFDIVPREELAHRVRAIADELMAAGTSAIAEYKRILRSFERPDNVDAAMRRIASPEAQARLRSFLNMSREE